MVGDDRRNRAAREQGRRAVARAVEVAVRQLRLRHPSPQRLLVALPTMLMGHGGDRRKAIASARIQIEAVYTVLDEPEQENVDVAFLTYTPSLYDTFLEARRQVWSVSPRPDLDECPSELLSLAERIRRNECALFIGSGICANGVLWTGQSRRKLPNKAIKSSTAFVLRRPLRNLLEPQTSSLGSL